MGARGKKRRRADGSIANGKLVRESEDGYFQLDRERIREVFGDDPDFRRSLDADDQPEAERE